MCAYKGGGGEGGHGMHAYGGGSNRGGGGMACVRMRGGGNGMCAGVVGAVERGR